MGYLRNHRQDYSTVEYGCLLVYKALRKSIEYLYMKWQRMVGRINEYDIVFMSNPDYSDNARALSEFMVENGYDATYRMFWLVRDVNGCKKRYKGSDIMFLPRYDKYGDFPLHSLKTCMRAHYLVSTHGSPWHKGDAIKGQIDFLLWHGCGYKDKNTDKVCDDRFDKCLVPGPLFVKTKSRYWRISEDFFIPIGYPRYDWLLKRSHGADLYRERLLGKNRKLVIWMPTFRNTSHKSNAFAENSIAQFPLMPDESSWTTLDQRCQELGVVIVLKLHPLQREYKIRFETFRNIVNIGNNDIEACGINLYEFLAVTDGLVTDYSSVSFDYLILDRPIAYTLDDYDAYKSARGFVFDNPLEYMPGHHLYKLMDMFSFLECVSKGDDPYQIRRNEIKKEAIHESRHYCMDVVKAMNL